MRPHARLVLIAAAAATLLAGAAEAAGDKPPRTRHGQPDLQGLWTNSSVTMLQRPKMLKTLVPTDAEAAMMEGGFRKLVGSLLSTDPIDPARPAPPPVKEVANADFIEMDMELARIGGQKRTSWIVEPADGRIPFTDAGRKAARAAGRDAYDGPEGRPLTERCLIAIGSPEGPPMMNTGFNAHYQILQTREHVIIQVEMNHDVRVVRLTDRTKDGAKARANDRAHPHAAVRLWMGDSIGWWEGQTLVVETTNLPPGVQLASLGGGFAYGARTKITERLTRTAPDEILYQFTVEDPDYFTQPWRGEMPWRAAKGPIYEYACHEGNYSLPNALSGARVEEKGAAAEK